MIISTDEENAFDKINIHLLQDSLQQIQEDAEGASEGGEQLVHHVWGLNQIIDNIKGHLVEDLPHLIFFFLLHLLLVGG